MYGRQEAGASGFVHSVKVPRLYKTASLIVKRVVENGESLKQLIYSSRHKVRSHMVFSYRMLHIKPDILHKLLIFKYLNKVSSQPPIHS